MSTKGDVMRVFREIFLLLLGFFLALSLFSVPTKAETIYPYWIDENLDVWTKVNLTANGQITLYITKESGYSPSPQDVFDVYDDFSTDTISNGYWSVVSGTATITDGYLRLGSGSSDTKDRVVHTSPSLEGWIGGLRIKGKIYSESTGGGSDVGHMELYSTSNDWTHNFMFLRTYEDSNDALQWRRPGDSWGGADGRILGSAVTINVWYTVEGILYPNGTVVAHAEGTDGLSGDLVRDGYATDFNGTVSLWSFGGYRRFDDILIAKYMDPEPSVTITDKGSYYEVVITEQSGNDLTDYQIKLDGSSLAISTQSDSLKISDTINLPPTITISSPTNTSYPTPSITLEFLVTDDFSTTFHVKAWDDGVLIYDNTSYSNGTLVTIDLGSKSDGSHWVKIWANDTDSSDPQTSEETVYYTVDTSPPYVEIIKPVGTYIFNLTQTKEVPLNFTATDSTSGIDQCWYSLDGGPNVTLTNCLNTTISISTVGWHSLTLYANDTAGWENSTSTTFFVDFENEFRAKDKITGEFLTNFLIYFWNETYNTTKLTSSGVIKINTTELPFSTAYLRVTAPEHNDTYATLTVKESSQFNETYELLPASLTIKVFDERKPSLQLWFNLTITNGTTSKEYYNQTDFFDYYYNMPNGEVKLFIKSENGTGYPQRTYITTINDYTAVTIYAYLLDSEHGMYVRFHIVSIANAPIPNALVTAMKLINNSYVAVEQGKTDDSGTVTFWLDPTVTYKIKVEATGFVSKIVDIQPTSPDFTIILATDIDVSFNHVFSTISYKIEPPISSIDLNQTAIARINFTISDSSGLLSYWGMNVTAANGTLLYQQKITSSPSGGSIYAEINLTGYNQTKIIANFFFKKSGFDEYNIQRVFFIYNLAPSSFSLWVLVNDLNTPPPNVSTDTWSFVKQLIAIVVTTFLSLGTAVYIGGIGAGFVGATVLGIFVLAGWFNVYIYVLILMALIAIVFLRSGL